MYNCDQLGKRKPVLHVVRDALNGNCPDTGISPSRFKKASGRRIVGSVSPELQTLIIQASFFRDKSNEPSGSVVRWPVGTRFDCPEYSLATYDDAAIYFRTISYLLWNIALTGIFATTARSVGGPIDICEDWCIGMASDSVIEFDSPIFGDQHIGNKFMDEFSLIMSGGHNIVGSVKLDDMYEDCVEVGSLSDVARNLVFLQGVVIDAVNCLDYYRDQWHEHASFLGRPFREYAKVCEARRRLLLMKDATSLAFRSALVDSVDKDRLPPWIDGPMNLTVCNDWKIVIRPAD